MLRWGDSRAIFTPAAYLFHLCQHHPFIDGNKKEELVDAVLSVAPVGLSKPRLMEIFESRCGPLEEA
jgi:hypothetical protein